MGLIVALRECGRDKGRERSWPHARLTNIQTPFSIDHETLRSIGVQVRLLELEPLGPGVYLFSENSWEERLYCS